MRVLLLFLFPLCVRASDFIESVHAQGAEIAKEMVVEGNQVVWSPFSVVNVLPLITGDEALKSSYQTSLKNIKSAEGIEYTRLSTAFLKDKDEKTNGLAKDYEVEIMDLPTAEDNLKNAITMKFRDETGLGPPDQFIPDSLDSVSQLYLTSLLIKAEWESPFRYSQKGRFYLNETHAVKAKYMRNVGFYKYGELEGVDGKILALPFKNSSTTYLVIVLPNNSSGLSTVSQEFGKVQVGGMIQNLKTRRTQLTIPKISIDSQLVLQPKPNVKILHSGSIRFTYGGIDHRSSKLRRSSIKILRTRTNKEDLKFVVNHPFLFTIFDTQAGVLSYGEVLIPSDHQLPKFSLKSEPNQVTKLTQNAKSLSEVNDELGNQIYQALRGKVDNFAISPITLSNLLASYSVGAKEETQQLFFSNLNFKAGILELNNNLHYFNSSKSSNVTRIYGGSEGFKDSVQVLGTEVVPDTSGVTHGHYSYKFEVRLVSSKTYLKRFYLNERDFVNARFHEFIGRVKFLSLPYWDAKAMQLYLSPSQSLLLFIPNERSGIHLIEDGLQDVTVSKLLCQMKDRFVKLRLPSFETKYVGDVLPELKGIYSVDTLKFEGVGADNLTSIEQDVFIHIGAKNGNRYRSRAYNGRRPPSTRLLTDRPFVYYILDSSVGTLAVGRVVSLPNIDSPTTPSTVEAVEFPEDVDTGLKSNGTVPTTVVNKTEEVVAPASPPVTTTTTLAP